ncbi:MAG: inorganic phosphate transporter [Acidimicrobiales bacterium]|jgi:PiT family inorganic phosphate transporter|nr:inorganic phosphate transporter [Acidimicrobiales bacterium]
MDVALVVAVVLALGFALTNGFHDAANAIAALVATRAATPAAAIVMATVFNTLGPLIMGEAVAETVAGIVNDLDAASFVQIMGAALTAAVLWNVFTWRLGMPSSSGHALVGGLVGAALIDAGPDAVNWGGFDGARPYGVVGVLVAMAISPLFGFAAGVTFELAGRRSLRRATRAVEGPVKGGQWATSAWLAFSHGANDAAKAVGIIAALLLATDHIDSLESPLWVRLGCAVALSLGTAMGGWSIVRTIGRRIYRIRPIDGLAVQGGSAAVIFGASILGAPVSTTQVVASSVVGTGVGRHRWRKVRWGIVKEMLLAWITTLPITAGLAGLLVYPWRWLAG